MWKILLILLTGTAAGFLNTLAGGGSLLSMPMLIFLGLPSAVANGTNRLALIIQDIVAVTNFKKNGYFEGKLGAMLGIPAILGSIIGSKIAVDLPDNIFNKMLAVIMILVLILIIWQPQKNFKIKNEDLDKKHKIAAIIAFFFIGLYGGLFQAGVGFLIIISLTLITGFSLVKINSIKALLVGSYMLSSFVIFIINGKVDLIMGLALSAGNGLGAYFGSNFAVKKGDKWIKISLIIAVLIMASKLLIDSL